MKKYYQLLLVIISLISLISVIIYRNEYNRLRYVLEVLNFFGKPNGIENHNSNLLENVTSKNLYNIPIPAWQNLEDAHIYSAFWEETTTGGIVQAIGISKNSSPPSLMCNVWFTNQEKPIKGKFSIKSLTKRVEFSNKAYIFSCRIDKTFGAPFSVTYYKDSNAIASGIPVFSREFSSKDNQIFMCIKPDHITRNPTQIVEFLNYYQVLGIKHYIIYDNGLIVSSLLNPAIGLYITILPWNLPHHLEPELVHHIIEFDCLTRTKNTGDVYAILNWNELIVPSREASITSLLNVYDPLGQINNFKFKILDFCIDFEDEEKKSKTQLIFHKLHYKQTEESSMFLIRPTSFNDAGSQQLVDSNIAVVQRYVECFKNNISNKLNRSSTILRFNTDFVKTYLYQLWVTGKLFK